MGRMYFWPKFAQALQNKDFGIVYEITPISRAKIEKNIMYLQYTCYYLAKFMTPLNLGTTC